MKYNSNGATQVYKAYYNGPIENIGCDHMAKIIFSSYIRDFDWLIQYVRKPLYVKNILRA